MSSSGFRFFVSAVRTTLKMARLLPSGSGLLDVECAAVVVVSVPLRLQEGHQGWHHQFPCAVRVAAANGAPCNELEPLQAIVDKLGSVALPR
jgi:hypothetical protein